MANTHHSMHQSRSLNLEHLELRQMLSSNTPGVTDNSSQVAISGVVSAALQLKLPSLIGDLNGDGSVGPADFKIMSNNVGRDNVGPAFGDFNSDGIIDPEDWATLFANWTDQRLGEIFGELNGDLNEDGMVNAVDAGIIYENYALTNQKAITGDFNRNGSLDAADWSTVFGNWSGNVNTQASEEEQIFYWPDHTPTGHSRMLKLNPFLNDNIALSDLPRWLEENDWTREGPNAVLITMGNWKELQPTALYRGEDGKVTIESIADHVRGGMKNWHRLTEWWAEYLQVIHDAGYQVDLVAMDIESGTSSRHLVLNPPGGEKVAMIDVINYLYSNERWARYLPELDLVALNDPNSYESPAARKALNDWNHWAAQKNAEAWAEVFSLPAKEFFPNVIVSNFDFASYEGEPLLDLVSGLPRANAAVDGNSSPVLFLFEGYGYESVEQALAAFDLVRGDSDQSPTIVPWIAGPYRQGERRLVCHRRKLRRTKAGTLGSRRSLPDRFLTRQSVLYFGLRVLSHRV